MIKKEKKAIIPIGISGSGKTTLYNSSYKNYIRISRDKIRFSALDYPNSKFSFEPIIEHSINNLMFSYLTL